MAGARDKADRAAARRARMIHEEASGVEEAVLRSGRVPSVQSAALVVDTIVLYINKILREREVFPDEDFAHVERFGVAGCVCVAQEARAYLQRVAAMAYAKMVTGELERVVLVIGEVETRKVRERWAFAVEAEAKTGTGTQAMEEGEERNEMYGRLVAGIQNMAGMIATIGVTLPDIEEECSFEVLLYTKKGAKMLEGYRRVRPEGVAGGRDQQTFTLSTSCHSLKTTVTHE